MDSETADKLFEYGALFILLEMPVGSEFGIDFNVWRTDEKFKGIKMIPPGTHMIFYSAVSSFGAVAPRTSFFHSFKPREIFIRKWDPQLEGIKMEELSDEDQDKFITSRKELDQFLAPYPYDNLKKWISVSKHISLELIDRLQPDNISISSVVEFESPASNSTDRKQQGNRATDANGLPIMKIITSSQINFTEIPDKFCQDSATAAQITANSIDMSERLDRLMSKFLKPVDLLGELQFSFICFLLGQVFDAFEHWKEIVSLICHCSRAMSTYEVFYKDFMTLLYFHIREIPEDYFVDIVSKGQNFIVANLHELFLNIDDDDHVHESLKHRASTFKDYLTKKFDFDFSGDLDDCSPVVVAS